jgi:ankyrin repeat protein
LGVHFAASAVSAVNVTCSQAVRPDAGTTVSRLGLCLLLTLLAAASGVSAAADQRLVDASAARDAVGVRARLAEGVDVNAAQPDGATALHWAVYWDDLEIAALLLRAGARVDAVNELGVSALALACENGSGRMVQALLAAGASARAARPSGETVLMSCARTGDVAAVRALLAAGADPRAREKAGNQTALMWAAAAEDAPIVQALVEGGAEVNARSSGGFTPLLFAARAGALAATRLLVAAGANVNVTTPEGQSPLYVAAASLVATTGSDYRLVVAPSDHEALALFLVDHGASVAEADALGMTPLHAAVEFHKPALVPALLRHGADPNARIGKAGLPFRPGDYVARSRYAGATPFWLAANAGDVAMLRVLAAAGADPRLPNQGGVTPLMVAAGQGQTDSRMPPYEDLLGVVKYLVIEIGADINATDSAGQTAMHGAASASADAVIEFLAAQGAAADVKDRRGRTPVDVALTPNRPRPDTAALLRRLSGSGR